MACGRRHFEARQRPEAPGCWRHFSVSRWPEVCRARTEACKQVWAKNQEPELNGIILLKLHHEWYTIISVWAGRNLTRGRWFKMAQKLTLKRNYNPHQSRYIPCDVKAFDFSFPPSNLASGAAVMAAVQWFGLFPYTYDIRYISWLLL